MTQWIRCVKLGIAIYNSNSDGKDKHLALSVGDSLHITEECRDWYRGFNVKDRKVIGIFPAAYVYVKDSCLTKIGNYETIAPKELPVVQEMTTVLREWGAILKNLYTCGSNEFGNVKKMVLQLIDWRRHAMSQKLTADELKVLQQKATAQIDVGNLVLGLDLIVRDEQGNVINPEYVGTIPLFKRHRQTLKKLEKDKLARDAEPKASQRHTLNLVVNVQNFVCRVGDDADVIMALYDVKRAVFFSENYVIKWSQGGLPKDLDLLNNLRVLFTDLGSKDLKPHREQVFLVCQIVRIGSMFPPGEQDPTMAAAAAATTKRSSKFKLRRPCGVAVFDVTGILNGSINSDDPKQDFIPFLSCGKNDYLETVIKEAVRSDEVGMKSHKGQGLWASFKLLDGELASVHEEHPLLVFSNTAVARKMGFPEVIMPADVRNDFYVTLMHGDLSSVNGKLQSGNIEVTMQVCNREGQLLPSVICIGCGGGEMMSEYKSVVYYHADAPRWFETFKVAVPIEEFYNCHLRFTFRHRSTNEDKDRTEKDFAFAYVPFVSKDGTTIPDGVHDLMVYRIDSRKANDTGAYHNLLSTEKELERERSGVRAASSSPVSSTASLVMSSLSKGMYSWSGKEHFAISTLVCSTKLTHNADLLGLLNWKASPALLKVHLQNIMRVDGEEIVKFLQDTLDALFSILMQNSDSDLYDEMVFDALIFIISLIADRKYQQFRPVLDAYINHNYSATLAYTKLLVVFKSYVDNASDKKYSDLLFKAVKSIEYVMKFIIRSRQLFAALNDGRGKQQFEMTLQQLFASINGMMLYKTDLTLRIQGAALKFVPSVVADVLDVYDSVELAKLLILFVNNVPEDRLQHQKLSCLLSLAESQLFLDPESRHVLVAGIVKHVQAEIRTASSKELEVCAKILNTVVQRLSESNVRISSGIDDPMLAMAAADADMSVIVLSLLRTIIQNVIAMDRTLPLAQDYVAILVAILRQMSEEHYSSYIAHFVMRSDLVDFLNEILMVFRDLISKCVFPLDWNEMILLQNSVFLRALRYFSRTIRERFSTPFEGPAYQLWNNFFHSAITFLTQDALQLETFSASKRHRIIARYKDMRREMGFEIRSMWYNLGQNKIRFIPEMVGPILEMTLIPETELRKATIPIFFDMMQCEFTQVIPGSRANQINGSFHQFENEMITRLDVLVEGGRGDEKYRELFYAIIHEKCSNHSIMREQGLVFVETVQKLLQRLLEYRTIIHDECKENRMNCIVNLLNFYHDIERQEMYIRYLNKLCELHLQCDNYTEAAYTLLLYTKLLRWADDPLDSILVSGRHPKAQTHRELKCQLYYEIIDCFDKGKMWEKGIEMCEELVEQCKQEVFDYAQLSVLLRRQSALYDKILKELRATPMYFRVCYYGRGFPSFLQNKSFVFRGKDYEHLSDFTARLLNQFQGANVLNSLNPPSEEIMASDGRYLQINAVTPIFEPKKIFIGKNVSEQILRYYKSNEIHKFTFSRPLEGQNDVTHLWLERTVVSVAYSLPGILQWFQVSATQTFLVSPLESAVESIEAINERLQALIEEHRPAAFAAVASSSELAAVAKLPLNPLSMQLSGIVDPAVNGGISLYKSFYTGEYLHTAQPDKSDGGHRKTIKKTDMELIYKLKDVTTHQLVLLSEGLAIHGTRCPDTLRPFHEHMLQQFDKMLELVEKEYGIKPPASSQGVKSRPPTSSSHNPRSNSMFFLSAASESPYATDPKKALHPQLRSHLSSTSSLASVGSSGGTLARNGGGKTGKMTASPSRVPSAISTDSSDSSSGTRTIDSSSVIELTQTLTPARPPRPDRGSKSRPNSGNLQSMRLMSQLSLSPSSLSGSGDGFGYLLTSPSGNVGSSFAADLPAHPLKNGSSIWSDPADSKSSADLTRITVHGRGMDSDCPPALPEKKAYSDYGNTEMSDDRRHTAAPVQLRHNSHRNKPALPLPSADGSATDMPPPVPEKRASGSGSSLVSHAPQPPGPMSR